MSSNEAEISRPGTRRRVDWQRLRWPLLMLLAGSYCLLLLRGFGDYAYDDPYITYRYAENIAAGLGFVYNPGERVLSTTTPLYALLLSLPAALSRDVPLISNGIACLALAGGGLILYQLGRSWQLPMAGLILLLLYPTFPLLISTIGSESIVYITLILGAFLAFAYKRYALAALLLALATLTRADAALATAVIAGAIVLERYRSADLSLPAGVARLGQGAFYSGLPWRAALVYLAVLAPWFLFAWFYFGSPFPVTLAAKQHQGNMLISRTFWEGLQLQATGLWNNPLSRMGLLLLLPGLFYGWRRPATLLLPIWSSLHALAYVMLGVSGYFWYYAPLVPGLLVLVALGIVAITRVLRFLLARWHLPAVIAGIAAAGITLLLLWSQLGSLAWMAQHPDPRRDAYRQIGEWLATNSDPRANVGMLEVGIIGYYARRPVVDFAGLIQPDVARQMRPESTYNDTAYYAVEQYQPAYLVLMRGSLPGVSEHPAVQSACYPVYDLADSRLPAAIDIFQCQW